MAFQKSGSGNPGGRRGMPVALHDRCRRHADPTSRSVLRRHDEESTRGHEKGRSDTLDKPARRLEGTAR